MYYRQMDDLIAKGYALEASDWQTEKKRTWYLPHFGVNNAKKPNKVRIVFDAAAKTQNVCLNDHLLTGPDLLKSLLGVLMKFRQKPVAIMGDIKEMYLRIKIRPEDQDSQRFLWRGRDRTREPDVHKMSSMVFGITSSPCSALYIKNRNAREFSHQYPQAVNAILNKHYVDDYLDSLDTAEEAIQMIQDVTKIHQAGGFEICAWSSNQQKVLDTIPQNKLATENINLQLDRDYSEKTLGLQWNPHSDCFTFDVNLHKIPMEILTGDQIPTKRQMLRVVMSVFDPQGFLAPFIIRSKILLQDTWRSGVRWDESLHESEFTHWKAWVKDLALLSKCRIPRCYLKYTTKPQTIELHTFTDASEKAYAAVSYWRFIYEDGNIHVAFVASKSRVAPLRPLSIPRMELCGAWIGSRLAKTIADEHEYVINKKCYWTDSTTVLAWIKSDPRSYKTFVSHRLSEIDENTCAAEWNWIPSAQNPADDATKEGISQVKSDSRWLRGPDFLRQKLLASPMPPPSEHATSDLLHAEFRHPYVGLLTIEDLEYLPDITRFSQWRQLIRTAWLLMLADKGKRRTLNKPSVEHLEKAEVVWAMKAQRDSFAEDIEMLKRGQQLPSTSRLLTLTPKLDEHQTLRVNGRIGQAKHIEESVKYPIILDGRHPYTRLMLLGYHQRMHHGNTATVINEVRQKYWVTSLRCTLRSVISRCQLCQIQRAKPQPPRMADLPTSRMAHHQRPFTFVGVDYFGPMMVTVGRR